MPASGCKDCEYATGPNGEPGPYMGHPIAHMDGELLKYLTKNEMFLPEEISNINQSLFLVKNKHDCGGLYACGGELSTGNGEKGLCSYNTVYNQDSVCEMDRKNLKQ